MFYFQDLLQIFVPRDDGLVFNHIYENGEHKSELEVKTESEVFFGDGKPLCLPKVLSQ